MLDRRSLFASSDTIIVRGPNGYGSKCTTPKSTESLYHKLRETTSRALLWPPWLRSYGSCASVRAVPGAPHAAFDDRALQATFPVRFLATGSFVSDPIWYERLSL